ncbi:MAG: RagB/SusD family nutrient uptake outer membrane protein [Cyclobacteriaceae bacterium]|nr:RagB/SusD family nutrient uptake outer membrane protein [Cyclobacteriaceae bacterium]MCH8516954.1 RagB/SusD family nutrient uptake outer membrane protein [Cyclobacteriaceae bacterium]
MKLINIKKASIFLVLIMAFNSCSEDFLDRPIQGELTQENFPTTAEDALLATNAVYNSLRSWNYNFGGLPITDIMSDDAHKGSNPTDGASTVGPYENFTHDSGQDGLAAWWNTLYEGIKRANVVIENVPLIAMDNELRARYVAEAKFLRGLYYFDLVRAWGGVPIVLELDPPIDLTRSSREEVYQIVERDLLDAIDDLPEKTAYNNSDLGRATRGAAKSVLGKAYLFQHKYSEAAAILQEVINSGLYALDPVFQNTHSINGEFNEESVLEVAAIPMEGTFNGGAQYGNTQGVRGTPNRGWGFNRPTLDLMNSFDNEDPRMDATVIFLGEILDGIQIIGDSETPNETLDGNGNLIQIECYNQKVWVPGTTTQEQWGHNRRIIRYADVLLMAAEALVEVGNTGQAQAYLNEVRRRARENKPDILPDITESNPNILIDLIFKERRHELALEGHRFWDLVRKGKATEVLGPLGFREGTHELFPIPQTEIDLTEGRIEQNPNWN